MATFVLVHGGGHGGWCYQPVTRRLQAAGHTVHAPSLPGMGEHTRELHPGIDLDAHIDDVVDLLFYEDLRDVVLVGHSYGGMVITGVADRAPQRIGHRVYLDAAYPRNGESLHQHAFASIDPVRQALYVEDGVELVMKPMPGLAGFFGITDPELAQWADERFTPQPWACFSQPLVLRDEATMRAIPESHLICTSTIPGRAMETLRERSQGRVRDVDTGHDLMLTEPQWVVDRLLDVAAGRSD
ncbi:alpha/beta fold hydrolase [Trujillonella endophytica]|uniref:Pimeloyl-ACP methyl ester carboxylesterase n=1 Tax=Trujillonella endophytica TaxID=673521 RepID=A0A1H8PGI8_9ACTN|nr:alpha/beta hydrolase [Trujillella endophytica]SEO40834.1 Pimeloyl-ACP methyl ester carboxylesterase [Trujillella endophytica]